MLVNLKNDFEFEQRKFTKEDIKEIIFRKILEYLPQLLKDYMHGSENTYYVLCFYLDISCNLLRGRWWKERASREKTFSSPKVIYTIIIPPTVTCYIHTETTPHRHYSTRTLLTCKGQKAPPFTIKHVPG
uniref:Uncharacterized protein n=1 Tax=Aegilops tauschii subsp. strangulata TaxID=200361 RepID=A0A453NMR9_AEGTS